MFVEKSRTKDSKLSEAALLDFNLLGVGYIDRQNEINSPIHLIYGSKDSKSSALFFTKAQLSKQYSKTYINELLTSAIFQLGCTPPLVPRLKEVDDYESPIYEYQSQEGERGPIGRDGITSSIGRGYRITTIDSYDDLPGLDEHLERIKSGSTLLKELDVMT